MPHQFHTLPEPKSDDSQLRLLRQVASPEELLFGWAALIRQAPRTQVDGIDGAVTDATRPSVPGAPGV